MEAKKYRFDYIREAVDAWNSSVPRDAETIKGLPWWVTPPWSWIDDEGRLQFTRSKDYYGEEIYDVDEWHRQRDEYIENLAKEYEKGNI